MLKKDPIVVGFETPTDKQNFLNWALQPSESSQELARLNKIK